MQNIDDNLYKESTPIMNITYKNHTLRIDCNEIGFSKRDVEAISRIGHSSKSELGSKSSYVGAKGIGFKSVFKVSDVAWIYSGEYSFKFDKTERLGMVAPIWADFPGKRLPGFTSILLQLSQDCDVQNLIREVKAIHPKLLIFLRRLKEVNIEIFGNDHTPWKTTLRRQDTICRSDRLKSVTLERDNYSSSYVLFRHPIFNLSHDPKRGDSEQSEILLAFPLNEKGEPHSEPQDVYAFLPIRDYGFKVWPPLNGQLKFRKLTSV